MSETEGEWDDLVHESVLEAATAQASAKRIIQLIPRKYYHLVSQQRLRKHTRFSNHVRVLTQKGT